MDKPISELDRLVAAKSFMAYFMNDFKLYEISQKYKCNIL